ncbi:YidC/Oxa1 family membrane protein insertase [Desulfallas thermosapovorans DSM 6562]|uniref:YidC/Oxa1 family membrane protein insertase n=1 Tax=Desulfallas thermosapovorans DSM 6562 TaxID=1121431 RepID=A0A5S4ZTU4_9FIRM|nr:YidC/Oxa1 family membrane protein insertase [Desulfallas thermosapovorans]TYO96420.1 YidC/Oxa1 family membrane protein insertase [Desulfallas thermosapovorans DSM 6562]
MGELFQALVDAITSLTHWLYGLTESAGVPSYGLAIILLTVLIKLVLFPLNQKQMVSMKRMQEIQPKIKELQEKYKNKDPQKMQQKMMELYREHNVNPMAGCLPILVQMPILIALYRSLLHIDFKNIEHAGFFWINSLSDKDPLFILPVLAGVTTYMQSKLTVSTVDQTQRMMLYMMPVFLAWISTTVPSGLVLYWVVFNILGFAQQFFVNRQVEQAKEGAPSK